MNRWGMHRNGVRKVIWVRFGVFAVVVGALDWVGGGDVKGIGGWGT